MVMLCTVVAVQRMSLPAGVALIDLGAVDIHAIMASRLHTLVRMLYHCRCVVRKDWQVRSHPMIGMVVCYLFICAQQVHGPWMATAKSVCMHHRRRCVCETAGRCTVIH